MNCLEHSICISLLSCLVVILLMKEGTEKPVSDPSSVLCKQPKSCRRLLAECGLKTKSEVDFDFATLIQGGL